METNEPTPCAGRHPLSDEQHKSLDQPKELIEKVLNGIPRVTSPFVVPTSTQKIDEHQISKKIDTAAQAIVEMLNTVVSINYCTGGPEQRHVIMVSQNAAEQFAEVMRRTLLSIPPKSSSISGDDIRQFGSECFPNEQIADELDRLAAENATLTRQLAEAKAKEMP